MGSEVQKQRAKWLLEESGSRVISALTLPLIPGVIALFAQDIADSLLIAHLAPEYLVALGFTLPITNTLFGLAVGLSVALVALLTKSLGEGRFTRLQRLTSNILVVLVVLGLAITLAGFFSLAPLVDLLVTESREAVLVKQQIHQYMWVRLPGYVFWLITLSCISIFRAIGSAKMAAVLLCLWSISTVMVNSILVGSDSLPIINSYLVSLQGLKAIAVGHLVSDAFYAALAIYLLARKEKLLVRPRRILFTFQAFMPVAGRASLNNLMVPLSSCVITHLVACFGTSAVAAYGIVARIEALALLLPMAMTASLPVFVGHNWAANLRDRVINNTQNVLLFVVVFQLIVFIGIGASLNFILPGLTSDSNIQSIAKDYLWMLPASYGALGVCVVANSVLNAIGKSEKALNLCFVRIMLVFLPLAYIGSSMFGLTGLFVGMALGNMISGIISYFQMTNLMDGSSVSIREVLLIRQ